MKVTDEDLLELASSINDLVCIENFEVFAKRHKKLVELYQRLLKDGLKTEYEYLCHENNEIIPCIVFDPIKMIRSINLDSLALLLPVNVVIFISLQPILLMHLMEQLNMIIKRMIFLIFLIIMRMGTPMKSLRQTLFLI